jgi:hypothetical protein
MNKPEEEDLFKIRLASSSESLEGANQLIQTQFCWRGYSTTELNLNQSPNRLTFLIEQNAITVGAITLVLDTPFDLEADEIFKAEVDLLRSDGRKLAEVTNLAMLGSPSNKRLMASIIHIAYIFARRIRDCTDFVIEVIDRHSGYYEKMLGFKRCSPDRLRPWSKVPTVLLCLELDYMGEQIGKLGGTREAHRGEKSLYPYFFSKRDEDGITARLRRG